MNDAHRPLCGLLALACGFALTPAFSQTPPTLAAYELSSAHVSTNTRFQNLQGGPQTSLEGNRPFSETIPLTPAAPAYVGPAIYGGFRIDDDTSVTEPSVINYSGSAGSYTGVANNLTTYGAAADALHVQFGHASSNQPTTRDYTLSYLALLPVAGMIVAPQGGGVDYAVLEATLTAPVPTLIGGAYNYATSARPVIKQDGAYLIAQNLVRTLNGPNQQVAFTYAELRAANWLSYSPGLSLRAPGATATGALPLPHLERVSLAGLLVSSRYSGTSVSYYGTCGLARLRVRGEFACWVPVPFGDFRAFDSNNDNIADELAIDGGRGEGGQFILSIAATPADPDVMLFTTDVAGVYVSRDGGKNWVSSNRGLIASGATGGAIDPRDASRMLVAGAGSSVQSHHGLFLSTDQGRTWRRPSIANQSTALVATTQSHRDMRHQIAYAPGSDAAFTRRVYWSPEKGALLPAVLVNGQAGNTVQDPGLLVSDDGGLNWALLGNSAAFAGAQIRCARDSDHMLIAVETGASPGLYRTSASDPGAPVKIFDGPVTAFAFASDQAIILATTQSGGGARIASRLYRLRPDAVGGDNPIASWKTATAPMAGSLLAATGLVGDDKAVAQVVRTLEANPYDSGIFVFSTADPAGLLTSANRRWRTSDGGATVSRVENRSGTTTAGRNTFTAEIAYRFGDSFLPASTRHAPFCWFPKVGNANTTQQTTVFSVGGDFLTRSTDAGQTYSWFSAGYTGTATTHISFNPHLSYNNCIPVLATNQDYNAAVSFDDGENWEFLNISEKGDRGYIYGGLVVNENVIVVRARERDANNKFTNFFMRRGVRANKNAEFTWSGSLDPTDDVVGPRVAFAEPLQPPSGAERRIFLASRYSDNLGVSWTKCLHEGAPVHLHTYDARTTGPGAGEIIGSQGARILRSPNRGASWLVVATLAGGDLISSVAYDHIGRRYYAAFDNSRVYAVDVPVGGTVTVTELTGDLPPDTMGKRGARFVAVDPASPNIVYLAGGRDTYRNSHAVLRSTASAASNSWQVLTRDLDNTDAHLRDTNPDGARDCRFLAIHPLTRDIWAAGGCNGVWRYPAP